MRRLSSYFFRVAGLSVLVAMVVTITLIALGEWVIYDRFVAGLPPDLRAQMLDDEAEISLELSNALNNYYTGWHYQLVTPLALLAGVMTGGLIGMVHARRLMRPLDAVAAAAARLATGETGARADTPPARIAEIDAFVDNFNAMADAVERSERELRETNAAIAHELRTPLTVLIGRLNGMADGIFPTDETGIRALLAQTALLQRIIDDLQLLTLADAGRFRLYPVPVDLADMAAQSLAAEAGGIEAALAPAPARADPERLRQILAALLNNARRYGREGLRVETGMTDGHAVMRVMDRGTGLTPAQAARVFDHFWRAEPSRGSATGGSGLGLAVVQMLAEAHGGRIRYENRPGGGACFVLELPAP